MTLPTMQLAAFVDRVGAAIAGQDGESMAQMLNLTGGCASVDLRTLTAQQVAQMCHNKLARFDGYAEVVAGIMQARKHLEWQSFADAYSAQIGAVIKFMEMLREETNWVMPFLHVLFVDTRLLATRVSRTRSSALIMV
ncbi:hypothetical protein F442_11381 [Phytophthora nicotianae P10297]|uniref:Uncharacterized protein n=1 Tax=Phytophthora nicotianae P10297 TaxID=1317064 RepID=W2Z2A9_PHYNI|nr:hypothetical protein F442_11381 [Phytophthora nicotianae P10297]